MVRIILKGKLCREKRIGFLSVVMDDVMCLPSLVDVITLRVESLVFHDAMIPPTKAVRRRRSQK